ncbi:hypothetical protein [Candidatus Electronema sp. JC]|uniref:hypothetical protein n=1 Tax=Candidatus Electronema sp. JC TaxID=3401570 RepID=UPI003B42C5E5
MKKLSGYSGGPCKSGSLEHVTFWADFDRSGSFETCLGTASVRAYDLDDSSEQSAPPKDGVWYAVRLPVDFDKYRSHCPKGPNLVPIRAILSWSVPAPCANPSHIPAWGNREETLICIAPKAGDVTRGKISILGGIPVSMIDDSTGLTTKDAKFATNNLPPDSYGGRPCPFGGLVTAQGAPLLGFSYKLEVIPAVGGAATAVVNDLMLTRADGTTWTHKADPATGRFNYVPFENNINGLLARWGSSGDANWTVRLISFNGDASNVGSSPVGGADEHLIQLDNTAPQAEILITSGAGDCGKFKVGDVIKGRFTARDYVVGHDSLLRYTLSVAPPDINHPAIRPNPSSGFVSTADDWQLETAVETIVQTEKMQPCGYVIRVDVWDRAIVNSQRVGHHASDSVGFCLEEPKK